MHLRLQHLAHLGRRIREYMPGIPDFYAILRLQSRSSRHAQLTQHQTSSVDSRLEEGMGLQLFAADGRTVFVSVDALDDESLEQLLRQGTALLRAHPEVASALTADFSAFSPLVGTRFMTGENAVHDLSSEAFLELLTRAHEALYQRADEHTRSMTSSLMAVDDEWRIFRSDGTDVHFNTWRTSFTQKVIVSEHGKTSTVNENECGHDLSFLREPERFDRIARRMQRKMAMGLAVLRGEPLSSGHYNVILDAGMAKGLAHEAFGHACESDLALDGSALTRDRKYLTGETVAPRGVSIVDFPMEGDWADQPFSANGFKRQAVAIVEDGKLQRSLSDIFSGPALGLPSTGAERVERFDSIPLPRMSNIRLEVADALDWDREYGMVEPEELFGFLSDRKLIDDSDTWLFLEGFRGGQVNTMSGDYVFNCTAIHKLEHGQVTTHPPAIFSGQVLKTLANVRTAIGPFELMRQGMCGKDGQRVPSSGGGHLFTLFNACDGITIGGR